MKIKIIYKKIKDLIFAEYNPRKLTKLEHQQLKDSLSRFGIVDPVIVNTNKERQNILVGGHQRVRIWEELGNESIPAVEINLTYDKERELNVRLNKNIGSWDFDMMANHFDMEELTEWGFKESEVYAEFETKEKKLTPDDCIVECLLINKDCKGAKIWENKTEQKISN